jgi:DNA-directed RNA polymerase I, II, and III subunit RPABC5
MTFPVRCFTCGNVIGNKYRYYQAEVRKRRVDMNKEKMEKVTYFSVGNQEKSVDGIVLDEIGITNMCCRIKFMTHVDI